MRKKIGLLVAMFMSCLFFTQADSSSKCVRGCENWGFFAEFLWVLNHLEWCEATNQTPVVYWNEQFAYYSKDGYNKSQNCWEYYFEPVSELSYEPTDDVYRNHSYRNFSTIWWYGQYIFNTHLLTDEERLSMKGIDLHPGVSGHPLLEAYPAPEHLYSISFRHRVKQLIDNYIVLKPSIQNKINNFCETYMKGYKVIGLHLRGAFLANEVGQVPIDLILEEANKLAGENTIFFIATDQNPLLNRAREVLKGKVIAYDCYRQDITTSPYSPGQLPPEQGEEVLIETLLLSRCDYFIHTISNVSTAVLYFNPNIPHLTLYCNGPME